MKSFLEQLNIQKRFLKLETKTEYNWIFRKCNICKSFLNAVTNFFELRTGFQNESPLSSCVLLNYNLFWT